MLFYIDQRTGFPLFDMTKLIGRLKQASICLRSLASYTLASVTVSLIKSYIIPLISYGIVVWYPWATATDASSINSIRYWYYSVCCYCTYQTKHILGWSNRYHTMLRGNSCESRFKLLLGLPSLEELYIAGVKAHIPQIKNMVELGWLEGTVKLSRLNLVYQKAHLTKRKLTSPLEAAIRNVAIFGKQKLKFKSKNSCLQLIETTLKSKSRQQVRDIQMVTTLLVFQKYDELSVSDQRYGELTNCYELNKEFIFKEIRAARKRLRNDNARVVDPIRLKF